MELLHLSLTNFRSFTRLDMTVPQGSIIVVGANAQGKTSLLEAVYYLAALTAFDADSDRQTIHFQAAQEPLAVMRIVGEFQRGTKKHRLEVRLIQEAGKWGQEGRTYKEVLVDGAKKKAGEAYGLFNAVLFTPQMLAVISGSPEMRRRYLNLTLSQTVPDYAARLAHYTRSLSQRNALLKQLGERGGDDNQLDYWDEQLADSGAHIIAERIQAVQGLETAALPIHTALTRTAEVLHLDYQPAYDPLALPAGQFTLPMHVALERGGIPLEEIRKGFLKKLNGSHGEEIARRVTLAGPHRDEARFLVNGMDLGKYGSRGQIRTAMLSLKLAEMGWMREKTGHTPVLLLDEVLAELDSARRVDLSGILAGGGQTLLTTTDLGLFSSDYVRQAAVWHIENGTLQVPER